MLEQIITALVGMLCGNIMMFLLLPQKRKAENLKNEAQNLENEAVQSEEWQKLYNEEREQINKLNAKIDSLCEELTKSRNENYTFHEQLTEAKIENTKLKFLKCERPACSQRQPPTGY